MIHALFVSSVSACFEWDGKRPYYSDEPFKIFINGEFYADCNTNVFSVYDLKPAHSYEIKAQKAGEECVLSFETLAETCALNVRDFGAVGDGVTDDTQAIQTALGCMPEGGRLVVPEGTYLICPLTLHSHMTLELKEGAVLLGNPDRSKYPIIPTSTLDLETGKAIEFGGFEGDMRPMYQSVLFASYATDIHIIGPGVVDGNAGNSDFWTNFRNFVPARPRLCFFNHCTDITVHGIDAKNSASWQMHPYYSDRVNFYGVKVTAPYHSPNTDAIDPEACDYVNIIGCRLNVGDDCIAIKSSKFDLAMKYQKSADHHTIRNCYMEHGHGAVVLGSEISAGVTNLTVSQCLFENTDRGLRIKTRRGRGKLCHITGVSFDNIMMNGVECPIVMNMWYNCNLPAPEAEYVWTRASLPVDERTPFLGEFTFTNMECHNCHNACVYCDGLPEQPIESVTLQNISFDFDENARCNYPAMMANPKMFAKGGLYFDNVKKVSLQNITVKDVVGDTLMLHNVDSCESISCQGFDK